MNVYALVETQVQSYGQETPGWISLSKLVTYFFFFFFFKYTETSISLVKMIGQWIPDGDAQGIARDIKKKNYCCFQNLTKNGNKLGQFTKLGPFSAFQLLYCPNFVTIFCWVLKIKIIFFDIPSYFLPIAVRNSLTNQFYQKDLRFCIFKKKKCKAKM